MTDLVTHSAALDDEAYTDVLEATRVAIADYLAQHGPFIESWRAEYTVASQFGHDGHHHPGSRFAAQVKRALNALAADGTLVKVGRGEEHPGGASASVHPAYYTPETFAEAEEKAAARYEAAEAAVARWQRCSAVLREQGFEHTPGTVGTSAVLLSASLDAWEALAARLVESPRA